jgi:DNA-binding NtrC family response regulator
MESQTQPSITTPPRVLLVVQEGPEARRLSAFLHEHGMDSIQVQDEAAGYNLLDTEQVDALVCETKTPRIDGLRLLRVARMRNPDVCGILLATPGDLQLATRAMDEGAHDFQTRPVNHEKVLAVIRRGLATQRMVGEMHEMARRLDRRFGFGNLIGNSAPIVRVYNRIIQVCGIDVPVLILGESGTGRELVAQAIHHNSGRRSAPLVRLDCEGMDAGFLERELFGEEGSGREKGRPGRVELAEGGTLVLAGAEDLRGAVQARLLRLVRGREFERTGGRRTRHADLRIIAIATHLLRERVQAGVFRPDLHEHLRAVTIELPALRHRKRDIPLLVEHFLSEATAESGKGIEGIKPAALDRLSRYSWPGNVRELKSVIRGMVQLCPGPGPLDVGDLPEEIREWRKEVTEITLPIGLSIAEVERRMIESTLSQTGGDRSRTAEILGIGLRTLQRRLAAYRSGRAS